MRVKLDKIAAGEAVFGSTARGDVDSQSDRDYLIVDSNTELLTARARELENEGWSVASYTFSKLEALSRKGALFVQHLKDESVIREDRENRLSDILNAFEPKTSYATELRENKFLANLIETRPQGVKGALWAADVLYVSLRNFGVLRLANEGVFKFSFRDIIENLVDLGVLEKDATNQLLHLRFLKSLYRSGELVALERLDQSLEKSLAVLPAHSFPGQSRQSTSLEVIRDASNMKRFTNPYCRLRTIEKTLIAVNLLDPALINDQTSKKLERWIVNPRNYAFAARKFDFKVFNKIVSDLETFSERKSFISRQI